jgi:hypothetical protein
MIRTIIDVLISLLIGAAFALLFVLLCPLGKTRGDRFRHGWSAMKRDEVRLLLVVQAVLSYMFIIPFQMVVMGAWTATWLVVFYCPDVIYAYVDCGKAWIVEHTGKAKDWAIAKLPKKGAEVTEEVRDENKPQA